MIILPAIDILNGQAVRLYQGDYLEKKCLCALLKGKCRIPS